MKTPAKSAPLSEPKWKPGTRIEVATKALDWSDKWEPAKIVRTRRYMLPMPAGYHPVLFDGGERALLIHESGFRVTDNRPAR